MHHLKEDQMNKQSAQVYGNAFERWEQSFRSDALSDGYKTLRTHLESLDLQANRRASS